ncbi:DnaD domain protein [Bacillus salipaludis]|uniref:DnaD domain protein n=1 Tax=Bacillus salipaludis TaxID=2547811 RepID=A0ABW8RJX3_9BACI
MQVFIHFLYVFCLSAYLLTNPQTTQIGIYKITKQQMAFDLGYSIESVHSLMERFTLNHKLIRYNPETRELAIKNWGKENLQKGGKPVMDCIAFELKEVEDHSLIQYVSESIVKQEIRSLYQSFCEQYEMCFGKEDSNQDKNNTYKTKYEEMEDTLLSRHTIGGQKENKKQKQKQQQQQQQEAFIPNIEKNPDIDHPLQNNQNDVTEFVEFWDANGFCFTNVNAKRQLLSWLDDSSFLQPKEIILKAMNIACANNKRKLNYIVGILKNWENESLLPDLESLGGMSYLSELLSYADPEKYDSTEKLILDLWKEREKRNILTVAAMNDWEIAKVIAELDKIGSCLLSPSILYKIRIENK